MHSASSQHRSDLGKVFLVGAGPGDPALFTLRGAECLRRADVVLYDYLVNPQVLEHAPATAELICLGRHGKGRIIEQEEIHARMIEGARAGKTVVRLKGGDPMVFARAAEELEALHAAGIPFEIVPGITAALAVGSYAGIPLTHRDNASAVALVTGHENADKPESSLDYDALARFPGTLVFYMPVTTAETWSRALIAGGKSAETPVAVVRHCSWPNQMRVNCTLSDLPEVIRQRRIRPPVVMVVGAVATQEVAEWFTTRPLFGRRVLVTRPTDQATSLRDKLQSLGAEVLVQPAITISAPADWTLVDSAIDRLAEFDWLVFSSVNGVRYFMDRVANAPYDLRRLGAVRLAAIGPGTSAELARYRLRADLEPEEFRAEALAAALVSQASEKRFLLARASRGREVLAEQLSAAGATVEQVVVYESRDVETADPEVIDALAAGRVDFVTVTSSAIAGSLVRLFPKLLAHCRLASISPVTSATLRQLGFEPAVEAATYTTDGLVEAILKANAT